MCARVVCQPLYNKQFVAFYKLSDKGSSTFLTMQTAVVPFANTKSSLSSRIASPTVKKQKQKQCMAENARGSGAIELSKIDGVPI